MTPEASTPTQETSLVPPPRGSDLPSWRACARACRALLTTGPYRVWAHALFALATSIYLIIEVALHVDPVPALEHARIVSPLFAEHLATCRDVKADARVPRAALWREFAADFAHAPVPFELLFQHTCTKIGIGEIIPQYFDGMQERQRRALWEACLRVALVVHAVQLGALVVVCYATIRRVLDALPGKAPKHAETLQGHVVTADLVYKTQNSKDHAETSRNLGFRATDKTPDFKEQDQTSHNSALITSKHTKDLKAQHPGKTKTKKLKDQNSPSKTPNKQDKLGKQQQASHSPSLHRAWQPGQRTTTSSASLQHAAVWFAELAAAALVTPALALLPSQPIRASLALTVLLIFGVATWPRLLHGVPGFGVFAAAGDAVAAALWVALALATAQSLVAVVGMLAMAGLVALRASAWPVAARLVSRRAAGQGDEVHAKWPGDALHGDELDLFVYEDCCGVDAERCAKDWLGVGAVIWSGERQWYWAE